MRLGAKSAAKRQNVCESEFAGSAAKLPQFWGMSLQGWRLEAMDQIKVSQALYPYFEKTGKLEKYAPHETIYMQGEDAQRLYFIKKGRVRALYMTKAGKELTFEIVEKGKIIGESSFLGHSIYPATVEAVNDVELLACDLSRLYEYMAESTELTWVIIQMLSRTCNHLTEQLRRVTLYDRYQKIASFLLHETTFPDFDRGVTKDSIPYTQEELGISLGLNRVTVAKVLNEWKNAGIVATAYGRIQILDRAYLERLIKYCRPHRPAYK